MSVRIFELVLVELTGVASPEKNHISFSVIIIISVFQRERGGVCSQGSSRKEGLWQNVLSDAEKAQMTLTPSWMQNDENERRKFVSRQKPQNQTAGGQRIPEPKTRTVISSL